jgi:hypothetical protein
MSVRGTKKRHAKCGVPPSTLQECGLSFEAAKGEYKKLRARESALARFLRCIAA